MLAWLRKHVGAKETALGLKFSEPSPQVKPFAFKINAGVRHKHRDRPREGNPRLPLSAEGLVREDTHSPALAQGGLILGVWIGLRNECAFRKKKTTKKPNSHPNCLWWLSLRSLEVTMMSFNAVYLLFIGSHALSDPEIVTTL